MFSTMMLVAVCCSSFFTRAFTPTITTLRQKYDHHIQNLSPYLVRIPVEMLKRSMRMM